MVHPKIGKHHLPTEIPLGKHHVNHKISGKHHISRNKIQQTARSSKSPTRSGINFWMPRCLLADPSTDKNLQWRLGPMEFVGGIPIYSRCCSKNWTWPRYQYYQYQSQFRFPSIVQQSFPTWGNVDV